MTPPPPFEKEFFVPSFDGTVPPFGERVKYGIINGGSTEVVG